MSESFGWLKHPKYNPMNFLGNLFSRNDQPNPGYDVNGNAIPINIPYQSPSYSNDRRLTDAYQSSINTYQGTSGQELGPLDDWLTPFMEQAMNGTPGYSGKAEGAAAASAFNPVFASLAAEKLAAERRGKRNQKDIKGAYGALAGDYREQAAAEIKGHAKATKEQNQAFAKDVYETKDSYTKIKAESDAEAARLGQSGTSAQAVADQKIAMASAEAVDTSKYQERMNKAASDQTSKSQSNYMTRGSMIAPQAGAEQVNLSKMKLEDVLLGLNREEAQAKLQQAAARISAQSAAHRDPSGPDISTMLAINNEKQDIQDRFDKSMQMAAGGDPSKLKGLGDAYAWGIQSQIPQGQLNSFMTAFQNDADINNGTFDVNGSQKKLTKEQKMSKLYTFATQAGIGTVQARQLAEIYARGV